MKPVYKNCLAYLAGIAVMLLTARLGVWQWQRASEKSTQMKQWVQFTQRPAMRWQQGDPLPLPYQRLVLTGQWLLTQQILVDNRSYHGRPGFHVLTPLLLASTQPTKRSIVVVNRGWVAKPMTGLPVIAPPTTQTVLVQQLPLPRFFAFRQDDLANPIWQNLDWPRYQQKIGQHLQPFYLIALSDLGDRLIRDWPLPETGESRHRMYAMQWFALCLLTAGFILYFTLRRR